MINVEFKTIIELIRAFPDEQTCINHLEELRWNGNVISPFDANSKVYKCKNNRYKCKNTGKYFNVKTATLFDNSKIELQKWFLAIWVVTAHKKGISSLQLSRDIDVTQKTAWFMLHRIRNCFGIKTDTQMENIVEVDETYIGGKAKNKHTKQRKELIKNGRGSANKTTVFGILERDTQVQTFVVPNPNGETLKPIINKLVLAGNTIVSDTHGAYYGLSKRYNHQVINHISSQYVNGKFHTNTIEGFWSLLKRGIYGIYHQVSTKHLQYYLNEFSYRYNSRNTTDSHRFHNLLSNTEYRLTYKKLIS